MFVFSLILIIVLTIVDQVIKIIVVDNIAFGDVIEVIKFGSHKIFSLTHVINEGAAWNMMSGKTWFLIGFPCIVLVVALVYMYKQRNNSKLQMFSLALFFAGGLGNLIDRIRLNYVVDYIRFEPINFPIFNFADICVVVGAVIFCIYLIFIEEAQKKKENLNNIEKAEINEKSEI